MSYVTRVSVGLFPVEKKKKKSTLTPHRDVIEESLFDERKRKKNEATHTPPLYLNKRVLN